MTQIEALYIFSEHNTLLFAHTYTTHPAPPPPSTILPLYLAHSTPRPSLIYLPSLTPPTLCYSITQDNLLFLSPSSTPAADPLQVLEFLHRVADALEEFLGSPLLASKITASYDVLAQILSEIADAGTICQGEANALRDVVETGPGVLKNLLGSLGAAGTSPALPTSASSTPAALRLPQQIHNQTPSAIPWRRSNVRHTSNELYVDLVETLSVTLAPSGRPLAAFAYGSVAFTCKVSGVPDLLLSLSTDGKGAGMGTRGEQLRRVMERAVFHPCVRLNKWKSDGVLSFVPPDGRFALCGYEVDLLGRDQPLTASGKTKLAIPALLEVNTGLGTSGAEFEVRILIPSTTATRGGGTSASSAAAASLQSHLSRASKGASSTDPKVPVLEDVVVHVPLPASSIRKVTELRPSKGEADWSPVDARVEWRVPGKDLGPGGAVLRCSVQDSFHEDDDEGEAGGGSGGLNGLTSTTYDYDEDVAYQAPSSPAQLAETAQTDDAAVAAARMARNRALMPTSATLSFSIKGWLASGLRVESLLVDTKKSRGLGPEVKPYKGVKYLTVSRGGVEVRC